MEIIPKKALKPSKSLNVLLYFSLVFLFLSVASFFVFGHFIRELEEEQRILEKAIAEKNERIKPIEEKLEPYQKKIDNFSFLINQQLEVSKFFTAFEKIIHPQVWFSEFNLNLEEKKVTLSGHAGSLEALKQQILIFQNAKDLIREVDFTIDIETVVPAEEIAFSLSLVLNPKIFNK